MLKLKCVYDTINVVKKLYAYIGSPSILKITKETGYSWLIKYEDTIDWIQKYVDSSKYLLSTKEIDSKNITVLVEIDDFDDLSVPAYITIIKFTIELLCILPTEKRISKSLIYKLNIFAESFRINFDIEQFLFEYCNYNGYSVYLDLTDNNFLVSISQERPLHFMKLYSINSIDDIRDICSRINSNYIYKEVLKFIESLLVNNCFSLQT